MNVRKILSVLSGFCILVALLITSIDLVSFDRSFYEKEYEKYNNAETIKISDVELMEVTEVLLGYLEDDRDDLSVTATIDGNEREVFNQKEKDHMIDVKVLYQNALFVRNLCVLFAAFVIGWLFYDNKNVAIYTISSSYVISNFIFFGLFLFVSLYALVDFNSFWTAFHKIVFTNDLWLLNPNTDILIMMVPLGFFFDLVFKFSMLFCVSSLLLFFIAYTIKRKGEKTL